MKKFFTFFAATLASMTMMAETVTMDLALAKGSTPAPSIGEALLNGGAFDGNGYKMGSDGNFIGWNIAAAEQTFSAVTFNGYINTTSTEKNWGFQFSTDGGTTWGEEVSQANDGTKSYHDIAITVDIPEGANALRIIRRAGTSTYVGSITLTIGSVTPPAPATEPCTTVTIEGPTSAYVGDEVTFKATGFDATPDVINWYDGNFNLVSETNTYKFTPTAAGDYIIQVTAWNAYNKEGEDEAFAYTTLKVSDPADACGELIKAVLNGGTSATMSGVLGGTFDTNLGSGKYKLDKNRYIGVQLAAGSFMAGDVVTITMSTAGQNYPCLFADKDRKTCLFLATEVSDVLEYEITLPAEADGLTTLYLSRGDESDGYKWNPTVSSISVNRSCEASSNADLKKVWVMAGSEEQTFEPEEDGVTYNLVVPASVEMTELSINYTLAHPKATADVASPFVVAVPAAGAAANSQTVVVTAQDGTKKTYTFNVTKSAAASTDATLKSLAVTGFTLDPAFAADVYTYTITKAYGAANPGTDAVVCEPNDATAHDNIQAGENSLIVTVTAEDGKTQLIYTINIVEAAAKKELLRAEFSNGVYGFIANGNIDVPYLAGEAVPTFVSVEFWQKDGEPTYEIADGKLVVTGVDDQQDEYTINYIPLTPMEATYDEITFTEVPSYIYSIYGFAADKGVKFSKDVEEATNRRISEGKDRIYMALPVAKEVILTGGSAGERSITITINGVASEAKTPKSGETITVPLVATTGANLVGFESKKNNGDAGFTKIQLVEGVPTALDNIKAEGKAVKVVINGQLYIKKGDKLFNALGTMLK